MIGDRVRNIRLQSGLSAIEFCNKINISRSSLSNIENNVYAPSDDVLKSISLSFNIDYLDLKKEVTTNSFIDQKSDDSRLGNKIKEIRDELGFSQEELAEKLGYSTGAQISYIESGKRSISRNKIIKFCQLFNKPIEELLFEIPNNKKDMFVSYEDSKESNLIKKFIILCQKDRKSPIFASIKNLIEISYDSVKE